MGAVLRDSALYAKNYTNKYLADNRTFLGRPVIAPFEVTYASPSTIADTYNCCVIPANYRVVDLWCVTTVNASSVTWAMGDAGVANRYMVATAFTTVNTMGALAATGSGYTPTADTIVVGVNAGAAGTVGAKVSGYFLLLAPNG